VDWYSRRAELPPPLRLWRLYKHGPPTNQKNQNDPDSGDKKVNLRRVFLSLGLRFGAAVLLMSAIAARADGGEIPVKEVTAITQVFGSGQKLTAVALEYDRDIDNSRLSDACFHIEGRTITKVYANAVASLAEQAKHEALCLHLNMRRRWSTTSRRRPAIWIRQLT